MTKADETRIYYRTLNGTIKRTRQLNSEGAFERAWDRIENLPDFVEFVDAVDFEDQSS